MAGAPFNDFYTPLPPSDKAGKGDFLVYLFRKATHKNVTALDWQRYKGSYRFERRALREFIR